MPLRSESPKQGPRVGLGVGDGVRVCVAVRIAGRVIVGLAVRLGVKVGGDVAVRVGVTEGVRVTLLGVACRECHFAAGARTVDGADEGGYPGRRRTQGVSALANVPDIRLSRLLRPPPLRNDGESLL